MKTKRITVLSVLTALAMIMFMVESLFPPLFIPGAKLGLSNIFTLLALVMLGPADALALIGVRTILGSAFFGGFSTLMYSLPAGIVSVLVSILLLYLFFPHISIVAISVTAAVMHNLTQNIIYCVVSRTPQMYAYMPYLALVGVLAGLVIGFTARLIVKYVPLSVYNRK
ncbi:MAG: Gx transporter family protein [Christensenellales bacterium]